MRIDKFLHKIKIENSQKVKKLLDQTDKNYKRKNIPLSPQNKNQSPKTNTNSKIISLLENLNTEQQKELLNTLLKMNLPLNESNLKILINLINTKTITIKSDALIKAMAIMQKGGLSLEAHLLEGISRNFDPNNSQSTKIIEVLNNQNNSELKNTLSNLLIDLSSNKENLTKQLKNFTLNLDKSINSLFTQSQDKNNTENKLLNQFLGQKIINKQNSNLLLNLELPLLWQREDKTYPLYLKMWKEENNNKNKTSEKEYKIAFNIELDKLGLISALIKIKSKNIKATFKSNNKKTIKLIERESENLKEQFENLNYNLSLELKQQKKEKITNKNVKNKKDYKHIDIKV
ncbi:MAG: flagellar hook-length control protein FliK [Bacillota bacterium]